MAECRHDSIMRLASEGAYSLSTSMAGVLHGALRYSRCELRLRPARFVMVDGEIGRFEQLRRHDVKSRLCVGDEEFGFAQRRRMSEREARPEAFSSFVKTHCGV